MKIQLIKKIASKSLMAIPVIVLLLGCDSKSTLKDETEMKVEKPIFLGPRTVVYFVSDLEEAIKWYTAALGFGPYYNEDFYVGLNVEGYELGLMPGKHPPEPSEHMSVAYWGVENIEKAVARLTDLGASIRTDIEDVGVKVATLVDPFGNVIGVLEHPSFPNKAKPLSDVASADSPAQTEN